MIEEILKLLNKYEEKLKHLWERVGNEVHTPQLKDSKCIYELRKEYPLVPDNILRHNAWERQLYVKKKRDEIINEEAGELYKELKKLIPEMQLEDILDLSKVINEKNKEQYLKDKLNKYN